MRVLCNFSHNMMKHAISICEDKGADQMRSINRAADQRLCFRYRDSTTLLLKPLVTFCGCTARFVSDRIQVFSRRVSFLDPISLIFPEAEI